MKLSIIIPTLNRYADLCNTLRDLFAQNFDDFEVIVIDQSDEKERKFLHQFAGRELIYMPSEEKSASHARNVGIEQSRGEVLLFVDDDVIIEDKNFLEKHYRHYKDGQVPGVIGCPLEQSLKQEPRYHRHWFSAWRDKVGWLYFPSNYGCHTFVASGRSNNLSVRREHAINVGGMDENFEKGAHREEADFCMRIYKKYGSFLFDPQARLIHIGNQKGGIRAWNDNQFVKAKHHMVGAIYFVLHTAPKKYFPIFVLDMFRYFLINKTILKRPQLWALATSRMFSAFFEALKKHRRGGIYLNKVDKHS